MHRSITITVVIAIFLALSSLTQAATVKRGNLTGQAVKFTKGTITLDKTGGKYTIKLGSNFKTKSGPGVYLYLGNGSPQKRIGKLRSVTGAQSFRVPASVDPTKYSTVYIYCAPFRAVFGKGRW